MSVLEHCCHELHVDVAGSRKYHAVVSSGYVSIVSIPKGEVQNRKAKFRKRKILTTLLLTRASVERYSFSTIQRVIKCP
jgi:hypothetical protein